MKKLLVLSMVLMLGASTSVLADENDTYMDQLLEQHAKRITETEQKLNDRMEDVQNSMEEAKQQRNDAIENKLEELQQLQHLFRLQT